MSTLAVRGVGVAPFDSSSGALLPLRSSGGESSSARSSRGDHAARDADAAGEAGETHPAHSAFATLLRNLGREVDRGESLVRGALKASAATSALGPAELIALQAGVYRYSEVVDLTSRLVEHATSGVKTVIQSQ